MYIYIYIYIYMCVCACNLIVYNLCKNVQFNVSLIHSELGKHVCIFLHSFILWQIDTYLFSS